MMNWNPLIEQLKRERDRIDAVLAIVEGQELTGAPSVEQAEEARVLNATEGNSYESKVDRQSFHAGFAKLMFKIRKGEDLKLRLAGAASV